MATFPGFISASSSILGVPDDKQEYATRLPQQSETLTLVAGELPHDPSAIQNELPITLRPASVWQGFITATFFNDYYNRIHFIPAIVELGAVSSNTSVPISIWNAYLKPVTLEGVTFVNQGGIDLTGAPMPVELFPLQTVVYNVEASSEGAADIDSVIVFQFDTETFGLIVTGTRARISPFIPNWSSPFEIEYQFKTDMFTSRNGKEQRRALRTSPRKSVGFKATPTHDRLRKARNMLAGWHSNTIIMPEVPRQASLRLPVIDGSFLYLKEDAPAWMVPGQSVVIATRNLYETREIVDVVGDTVQLAGSIPGIWPIGTKVHPGLAVRFADSISVRNVTNEVATISVQLEVIPGSELYQESEPLVEFKGREAWLVKPNWADPIASSFQSQREVVDYGRGRDAVFLPIPFGTVIQKLLYTGRDYEQSNALVDFFLRCKGQLNEFYMPTFTDDVKLGYTAPAGQRTLRIAGQDFFRDYENETQRKAVAIFMRNGDVVLRGVNSFSKVDDTIGHDSALDLDEDLPYALTLSNVKSISFMPVWRMASDTFSISWLTNTKADCQLSVRMLEDLPA